MRLAPLWLACAALILIGWTVGPGWALLVAGSTALAWAALRWHADA